jgi:hypothetical protein
MILRSAKSAGVKRLIVTHPLLDPQFTSMSLEQLRAATELGAFIELTGGAVIRDGEPKKRALEAVRTIGARYFSSAATQGSDDVRITPTRWRSQRKHFAHPASPSPTSQ